MTTLRKYLDVVKAEMDKSLLEAAGIPAFIAGENSAAIGYGNIFGEVRLQVQDADVDRARQVLQDNKEAAPLSDDFVPTAAPSPSDDSVPKTASQQQGLETPGSDTTRIIWSATITLLVVFAMFVAFGLWKSSHSATAYYRSGIAKGAKGDLDGAIADFNKAIELNSRYARAYDGRGIAKWGKGDLNGAIADYDRTIELDPNDAYAHDNRGVAKQAKGDLDGALADYNRAVELNPKSVRAYDNRGIARRAKGNLDGAIADFDKALELNPKYTRAYENRGFIKSTKGDLDGAISDYNRAIELDPKNARSYDGRSFVKRIEGDLDGAISDYDRAIELNPKDAHAYYGRGVARYDRRDWSTALSDFRKASTFKPAALKSETVPDYSRFGVWMARTKLGERDEATSELKQYLLVRTIGKPNDWPSTIARFLTGDVSENDFLKAAESGDEKQTRNQRCEAYFYVGTLRLINGDKSTAADYFKKCLDTGVKDFYEYRSAAAELQFLKSELPSRQD